MLSSAEELLTETLYAISDINLHLDRIPTTYSDTFLYKLYYNFKQGSFLVSANAYLDILEILLESKSYEGL